MTRVDVFTQFEERCERVTAELTAALVAGCSKAVGSAARQFQILRAARMAAAEVYEAARLAQAQQVEECPAREAQVRADWRRRLGDAVRANTLIAASFTDESQHGTVLKGLRQQLSDFEDRLFLDQ